MCENWDKELTRAKAAIFKNVWADLDDGDLMVAINKSIRGHREFMPTAGQIATDAKDIQNKRMREERMIRERHDRTLPAITDKAQPVSIMVKLGMADQVTQEVRQQQEARRLDWEERGLTQEEILEELRAGYHDPSGTYRRMAQASEYQLRKFACLPTEGASTEM